MYIKEKIKSNAHLYSIARTVYRSLKALKRMFFNNDANYFKCLLSANLRIRKSWGRPTLLLLEPINICNLRCPTCETGSENLNRKQQVMRFAEFKYILDQFDKTLRTVYLFFMGESFLNKDIYDMIRYAADKGLYVSICTNGELLDATELAGSGLAEIHFQIAGVTEEAHSAFRQGGKLEAVLGNIKRLKELRDARSGSSSAGRYPLKLHLGFIVLRQNEYQLEAFKKLSNELGADGYDLINACVRDIGQAKKFLPEQTNYWRYDPDSFKKGRLTAKRSSAYQHCEAIYSSVVILVNGDVVPCCRDPQGKYVLGNVFIENIYHIWNNKKSKALRAMVNNPQKRRLLCELCEGYTMPKA